MQALTAVEFGPGGSGTFLERSWALKVGEATAGGRAVTDHTSVLPCKLHESRDAHRGIPSA